MGVLDEAKLSALIAAGCAACGKQRLRFATYIDVRQPILGGEPVSKRTWCYDGEKFIDGVYEARCADCQHQIFSSSICPRCHAADGLKKALGSGNQYPLLAECPQCQGEELRYIALVPATVIYEQKRAAPPRSETDPYDAGFHGFRVDCADCGTVALLSEQCPLCAAPGPLRERPG